jgi:hypothetical protein
MSNKNYFKINHSLSGLQFRLNTGKVVNSVHQNGSIKLECYIKVINYWFYVEKFVKN